MRGRSGRAMMTLVLASRKSLSLLSAFPRQCIIPAVLRPLSASSSTSCLFIDKNKGVPQTMYHRPGAATPARCRFVGVFGAPLSMAAARPRPRGNRNSSTNESNETSKRTRPTNSKSNNSSSSSSSRSSYNTGSTKKDTTSNPASTSPYHMRATSSRSPDRGVKRTLSAGNTAVGGRSGTALGTGRGGAGGRGWVHGLGAGGAAGGRGGRGGSSRRAIHDSRAVPPASRSFGEVPEDQLEVSFTRASGAGGQNVNKVSTKVEMRFVVSEAEWLPHDVRVRLARQEKGRINNRGELVVTAQEFRTQKQNRTQALRKLREMIIEAWEPEKERKMRTGISKKGKELRKQAKLHRSKIKAGRSKLSSRDFD